MTRKEELLEFIETNIDDIANMLLINTYIIYSPVVEIATVSSLCSMGIKTTKDRTTTIITNYFDDDLIGCMPHGTVFHVIDSWEVTIR